MMQADTPFVRRLKQGRPLLLDGGLATQLEVQGEDIGNALWSASLLASNADAIVAAHSAYLAAGAECIETATYQASREGFATIGLPASEADRLMLNSIALAKRAREAAGSCASLAASLGPYGVMLHDGSEYTGNYGVSSEELRAFHAPRIRLFDGSDVDVIALETVPSLQEAAVLSELLEACTTPSWVSFSCRDRQRICDGSPLAEAVKLFASHPSVVAIGVNCTPPQYVPALLRIIRDTASDKFALAYPNSGEAYNAADNSWSGTVTPGDCADAARAWIEAGAAAVGGCCRMGPEHISAMAAMITASHS